MGAARNQLISAEPTDSSTLERAALTRLDLRRALALCLLVFAVSFLTYSRTLPPNADEMMNFALTESLAKLGRLDVDQVSTVGANPEEYGRGGHRYSKYGPAQAVLAVPLYWLAQRLPVGAVDTVLLENHALTALAAGLLYLLARRLGYRPEVALALGLLVVLTTPAWVHAKRFFGEPTTMLFLLLAVYWAVAARQTGRRGDLALAGLAAGATVAAKYVNLAFVAPVVLFAALPQEAGPRAACAIPLPLSGTRGPGGAKGDAGEGSTGAPASRLAPWLRDGAGRLFWIALGALPVAAALGLYDCARFGSPLESGYARWEQFKTPIWEGVGGFLFSPGKSVFVYAPLLLLLPFWGRAFWRRDRWLAGTLLVVFALHLGIYGAWWVWWGAWAWGPRFLVPLMPLAVLFLAEGLDRALAKRSIPWLAAGGILAALGLGVQVLGVAVDHTVYMAHLLPLNPRPDTLTLYDLSRQPVLAQLQFLTRRWLDFAWVLREGPSLVSVQPLAASALSLVAAAVGFAALWRARPGWGRLALGVAAAAVVAGATLFALNRYYRGDEPAMRGIAARLGVSAGPAAVVLLAPDHVVPYLNSQKAALPTLGWSEMPEPLDSRLLALLEPLVTGRGEVWLVSQYPPGVPSNGVEAWLGRRAYEVEEVPAGPLRLARYRVGPDAPRLTPASARFSGGIELVGYEVLPGSLEPGGMLQVTLAWRATGRVARDYTVFAHLVDASGKLVAQQDGQPGDGYRPTTSWPAGELIPDHHAIAVPLGAGASGYSLHVGLYLLATGERLPVVDAAARAVDDKVVLRIE